MFDYNSIKEFARGIKRPVKELLALSPANDPFYAAIGHRGQAAEWFAGIWADYSAIGAHLRRIHYRLVSPPEGVRILLPNGREYQNNEADWTYLCCASLAARYLDLIPFDGLIDRRNDEPMFFAPLALDPNEERSVDCEVEATFTRIDIPEMPDTPWFDVTGLDARQDFIVEVWIEKSTQNDWLVPLCQRRGVNLVVGIGEQSETRSRELAQRSAEFAVPVRVIYLSDFDPGGRSMPKAVARKVEFTIAKFGLDVDLQLIPLALTPDQCREYRLPRTPIKDTERRKDKFEQIFGVGATELDALEALYPGELARLLSAEIDNFIDPTLEERVANAKSEEGLRLRKIEAEVEERHADDLEELETELDEIVDSLKEWEVKADALWSEEQLPDLSDVEIPRSAASDETDSFVLFELQTRLLHANGLLQYLARRGRRS